MYPRHRRGSLRRAVLLATIALLAALSVAPVGAVDSLDGNPPPSQPGVSGEVKPQPPLVQQWQNNRLRAAQIAVGNQIKGERQRGVIQIPSGEWVEYDLAGTDHIVTLLAEFSDPAHGQIPEPNRRTDNSTYWVPNFDRQHYEDMLFAPGGGSYGMPSMRDYYLEQSSGRYTVEGQVSEWVTINQPESAFGADSATGTDDANGPVFRIVKAALDATVGRDIGVDWSQADQWDRYDCDTDGNFNEPDGYVDHFQIIHAGEGQEAGGGAQGSDAIWSHRWYANFGAIGAEGPVTCPLGGYQVPGTDLWVGDYTIEPENGGVGVFAHEFGHDLGLPDLYDTAGGDNGTGYWTLMSAGSWPSIGSATASVAATVCTAGNWMPKGRSTIGR